eukprot:gene6558-biopygen8764
MMLTSRGGKEEPLRIYFGQGLLPTGETRFLPPVDGPPHTVRDGPHATLDIGAVRLGDFTATVGVSVVPPGGND